MNGKKMNRRDFIKGAVFTGTSLALGGWLLYGRQALAALLAGDQGTIDQAMRNLKSGQISEAEAQAVVEAYMMGGGEPPVGPKVVHVYSAQATNWDFNTGYYGDYVNQTVVNNMVDRGVKDLTGASTVAGAWEALIPGYTSGKGIAIKVSHNNAWSCNESGSSIDGLIHPVNAVVRGLKEMGVAESDVWIYEAIRRIPDRFVNGSVYSNVQYFSNCRQEVGWYSNDPDAFVTFNPPSGPAPSSMRVPDVLINASYLINMPIIKKHDSAGVSLSFKNHLGTVSNPGGLHDYVFPGASYFGSTYNPMTDVYLNPHVGGKTVLTIGDGLYGCWAGYTVPPAPWETFENGALNSLFFATDPVALDSVMYDLLQAEHVARGGSLASGSDTYLPLAASAGLGVFEHGDPWGSGYSLIDYQKVVL